MFRFRRPLGAVAVVLVVSGATLITVAGPSAATTSLTLQQDQVDVQNKIDFRLNRLNNLNTSAGRSSDLTAAQREALQLSLAAGIANLGQLRLHVGSDTTVDAVEADRTTMTGYRINQVVAPRGSFIIRGMRMANRMASSAATVRAAKARTNPAADLQLTRAAAQLDSVVAWTRKAVADASKVAPGAAVNGATPFTAANSDWATALSALAKARGYLDAAQKADRSAPADTVIRAAEIKPATPLFDAP